MDEFISDFSIEEKTEEKAEEQKVEEEQSEELATAAQEATEPKTHRKAKPFLLILYILAALPITAAGVVLLLVLHWIALQIDKKCAPKA